MSSQLVLESSREARLYRRSQAGQWQADDLPWGQGVQLDERQKEAGRRVLSQILFGEQTSLQIVAQLLEQIEEPEARLFLAEQYHDEARHVAVFERYIGLLGQPTPPNPSLAQMAEGMLALSTVEEKLIGMHILIEGMALEIFHVAAKQIDDPLLGQLLRRVFQDESRHVAFGLGYARQRLAGLDRAGLERVAAEGGRYVALSASMVREEEAAAAEFGIDLREVQARTLRVLFRRLRQVGMFNALELF